MASLCEDNAESDGVFDLPGLFVDVLDPVAAVVADEDWSVRGDVLAG